MSTPSPDAPIVMTRSQYDARVKSEVRTALDELEVFFCLEDSSHAPASKEIEFMTWHGSHDFVRMLANDFVNNSKGRDIMKADAELSPGLYDASLIVDGEKVFQSESLPVKENVKVRILNRSDFTG